MLLLQWSAENSTFQIQEEFVTGTFRFRLSRFQFGPSPRIGIPISRILRGRAGCTITGRCGWMLF